MLLLIDIGNTITKIGFSEKNGMRVFSLKTARQRDTEEYCYILEGLIKKNNIKKPRGAAICSVVPEVTPFVIKAVGKSLDIKAINVTHRTKTGIKFPEETGADRIAGVVAARGLYKGDLIVVTFGTATTFNAITEEGKYLGGAIMPGLGLSVTALSEKTAKLPLVELKKPDKILSKDTEGNILSGVVLGHAGAAERIIREIEKESGKNFTVVATGGFAHLVKPYSAAIEFVNPLLTLEGLRLIYSFNL
ncbi:MAG: type III pantothenate kinase [Nitrospirae bacterium]|nr:type III pantothenate kinase [Nitrospirota bacterium]